MAIKSQMLENYNTKITKLEKELEEGKILSKRDLKLSDDKLEEVKEIWRDKKNKILEAVILKRDALQIELELREKFYHFGEAMTGRMISEKGEFIQNRIKQLESASQIIARYVANNHKSSLRISKDEIDDAAQEVLYELLLWDQKREVKGNFWDEIFEVVETREVQKHTYQISEVNRKNITDDKTVTFEKRKKISTEKIQKEFTEWTLLVNLASTALSKNFRMLDAENNFRYEDKFKLVKNVNELLESYEAAEDKDDRIQERIFELKQSYTQREIRILVTQSQFLTRTERKEKNDLETFIKTFSSDYKKLKASIKGKTFLQDLAGARI